MTWSQPNMTLDKIENNELNNNNNEYIAYESQTKLFDQFLFKSSRYISDQIFNTELRVKKLLFIKDIPYFAYREPGVFQNQMRKFIQYSKYSLVILSTNSPVQSNEMNPAKVLTQELRKELNINEITFNPLAASYMLKTIERIALLEGLNFVNENSINEICETSDGDLRHAINILELAANKSSKSNISTSTAKKRKLNTNKSNNNKENQEESSSSLIQKKDTNLSIFRGLGKVLHRKNDDTNQLNIDIENKLSSGLKKKKLFRSPLLYSPEDILSKLPISEEITVLYLHQNYLELYGIKSANSIDCETQLESLSKINDNFIASDIMNCKLQLLDQSTSVYNTKHKEMPALLSIRSILFYSYFEKEDEKQKLNSKSLWMPLHKPYNYKCNELKASRKNLTRKCLFRENNTQLASYLIEMQSEFFTTILPFANLKNMYRELASKYTNSKQLFKQPKSILNSNNENDPDYFLEDENSDLYYNNNNNKPTLNTIETTNNNNGKLYEYDDNVIIQAIYDF
jgi:DNA polymerase III delta prime subunit